MAGYKYRGNHTGLDSFDEIPPENKRRGGRPRGANGVRPCGTRTAYKRHKAHNETPCQPCIDAMRQYQRDQYARKIGRT